MSRRTLVAAFVTLAVSTAGVSATAAVAKTRRHVVLTAVGAQVGSNESVYDVRGTARGALVQLFNVNSTATAGASTSTFYDGQGTIVSRQTFTLSPPDVNGIVTITGRGRLVSGTGKYKGITGNNTFTGTFNSQTTVTSVRLTGTQTY